jgi:ABC-type uncharacterized transport system fused permease/ATPase subunit
MRFFRQVGLTLEQQQELRPFWASTLAVWRARRPAVLALGTFMIGIVLLQLLVQVLLNLWNRNFFDALERRDAHALWVQIQMFVPLAAGSIVLAATSVWGRMTAQRGWREALTRHVIGRWLANGRYARLNGMMRGTENPEYRIASDIRVSTDAPVDLALAFFASIITAFTFFGVLWTVGGSIDVPLFGETLTIPGYLVIGVILYSTLMSGLMTVVGHHLASVIERLNQSDAELREAANAFRGESNAIAADGEKRIDLSLKLQAALLWWRELCWQLMRTTLISHGNSLLAPVVAWVLCVPKYLNGAMTLGELTQTAAAFVTVQGAFNWLVDNYQRLADWRSSAHRVSTLVAALDDLEAKEQADPQMGSGF